MNHPEMIVKPLSPMPEWLRLMAPHGRVGFKDLPSLFGYRGRKGLDAAVRAGHFPAPDVETLASKAQGIFTPHSKRCWWSKKAVVTEYHRRMKYFSEKA